MMTEGGPDAAGYVSEYRCLRCGGPVQATQGRAAGEGATFYACARACGDESWHEDMMFETTMDRLEDAYKAGAI